MKLKAAESNITISERAKTAKPYTKEECRDYDKEKDPARILATMEQYLKKIANVKARLTAQPGGGLFLCAFSER